MPLPDGVIRQNDRVDRRQPC